MKTTITVTEIKKAILSKLYDWISSVDYGIETITKKEKIQFVYNTFLKEKSWHIKKMGLINIKSVLKDWCQGLPTCLNHEFYNYSIIELIEKYTKKEIKENEIIEVVEKYWDCLPQVIIEQYRLSQYKNSKSFQD